MDNVREILGNYNNFDIVLCGGQVYGLAQGQGNLDLSKVGTDGYRCVTAPTSMEVESRIDNLLDRNQPIVTFEARELLCSYSEFNVTLYEGKIYGFAQRQGELDLSKVGNEKYPCVVGSTIDEVKKKISEWLVTLRMPTVIEIEPTNFCNIRCKMCHVGLNPPIPKDKIQILGPEAIENMKGLKDCFVKFGNIYEPTINPNFVNMVKLLSENGCELEMVTNATKTNEKVSKELAKYNFYYITFSFDSAVKETYEDIRLGARFDVVRRNIVDFLKAFRGKDTYFKINTVLMKSNIGEIKEMIDFAESSGADYVSFLVMEIRDMENPELVDEALFEIKDVAEDKINQAAKYILENSMKTVISSRLLDASPLQDKYPDNFDGSVLMSDNSKSRYVAYKRNSLQVGFHPQMENRCLSPFVYAYVFANGDVQICRMFIIGNLYKNKFEDIWFGERAEGIRKRLLECQGTPDNICRLCSYYSACLVPGPKDFDNPLSYIDKNLIANAGSNAEKLKIFSKEKNDTIPESGNKNVVSKTIDELKYLIDPFSLGRRLAVSNYERYNIVQDNGTFYGVHIGEPGGLDPEKLNAPGYRCVAGGSVEEVKRLVDVIVED